MGMNRIYQGKVTAVEIPDGKDEQSKPLDLDVRGFTTRWRANSQ
jgi:hypothetical protein